MTESLVILGRQPALGLAELESLYGPAVRPASTAAAIVAAEVDFERLGGAIKCCQLIDTLPSTDWRTIETSLIKAMPDLARNAEGKLRVGVSTYGFGVKPAQVEALSLSLKKALKKTGHSVRVIPNKTTDLSSAQVFHNRLAEHNGYELVLVRDGDQTVIGRTSAVQDINSYTLRDRGRPKRDARVGMLPPKLAQIIINLAVSENTWAGYLLDPFCGTGVVLLEAALMDIDSYGTDLEPRMIEYSRANLEWLDKARHVSHNGDLDYDYLLEAGDATAHVWERQAKRPISYVASETYLGKPFTSRPDAGTLAKTVSECDLIIKKFLKNIHAQLPPATRLCLAVPAWQTSPGVFKHLPLIDQIGHIGYNRIQFELVRVDQLLYYREDQIVARQLLVLTTR